MITIRPASQPDIPRLADLVRQHVEYQLQLDSHLTLNPKADWVNYVTARLNRKDAELLVADKDGTIIGYTDIRIVQQRTTSIAGRLKVALRRVLHPFRREPPSILEPRRYGFIDDIYVDPSMRNSPVGVGVSLYRSSLSWFKLQQVNHIEGSIAALNEGTQTIAQKFGFKTVAMLVRNDLSGDQS